MTECCHGYEIVYPDGRVRRYPYHNEGDAASDARRVTKRGCLRLGGAFKTSSDLEASQPPCPDGEHTVRPIMVVHRSHSERGQG
jgi:hypothetical protein